MKKYQWGIVGLGSIANEFAENFDQTSSELVAVASRTLEKSTGFCYTPFYQKAYGDYHEMLQDAEVDIVYIAVPNRQHIDYILPRLGSWETCLMRKSHHDE